MSFQGAGHGLRLHDATRVNQFPRNQIPFPLQLLRFNFNPATVFLGDCGSMFIGFMLSALALVGSEKAPRSLRSRFHWFPLACRYWRPRFQ